MEDFKPRLDEPRPTPGGIRRVLVTAALALGLLVVGGTAVVMAASPEPSTSPAPGATTRPSTDDSTAPQTDGTRPDCPEGAGGGGSHDGTSDDGATDDGSSAEPSAEPENEDTTPSTTPDVSDSEV